MSFQEQVMTRSSCNYTIWERKKLDTAAPEFVSIIIFCITYFIWFMTIYMMRRTFVPSKVRRSPKLPCGRRSPELFARSMDFHVPVNCADISGFFMAQLLLQKNGAYINHEDIYPSEQKLETFCHM